ncbi:MAG: UDP-N-acetylglucosamine--N-acetylmuramyl-(pentapeptide) pyrophosphoryl-undecaprenol N-acetylglucosamine transferase [bacterium]|nr:UDP-N-acetylglucosamine--N-acetylmuramyl-(pentapeptide) pyrophosphoryl-undecaprenol N-acetylglucosamine transferase [bacterium]
MAKKLRIIFTGGGTGGHIYPIIAVSEKLRAWTEKNGVQADFRYFGNPGAFREALSANAIRISRVAESKWRRYFSLLNFLDIFKFGFSVLQCLWKIYWFMPDVVFSKGGPGSLPVVLVSFLYATPIVIHESDSVPGLANRLASRFARVIGLAFGSAAKRFPRTTAKLDVVGNPVRSELLIKTSPEQAKVALGFDPAKPLILIFGGSQGSNRMNDFILGNLEAILLKFQVMHVIGREKFQDYKNQYDFLTKNFSPILLASYKFSDYLGVEMSKAMDAADLIMARGGAGAIFEIAAKGKPAIIVPFPEASADHQKENGYAYASSGAAVVIEQDNLLPSIFLDQVEKIVLDPEVKAKMSSAATAFYQADAADRIAVDILEFIS